MISRYNFCSVKKLPSFELFIFLEERLIALGWLTQEIEASILETEEASRLLDPLNDSSLEKHTLSLNRLLFKVQFLFSVLVSLKRVLNSIKKVNDPEETFCEFLVLIENLSWLDQIDYFRHGTEHIEDNPLKKGQVGLVQPERMLLPGDLGNFSENCEIFTFGGRSLNLPDLFKNIKNLQESIYAWSQKNKFNPLLS